MVGPDYPEEEEENIELSEEDLLMMDAMEEMERLLDVVEGVAVVYSTTDEEGESDDRQAGPDDQE